MRQAGIFVSAFLVVLFASFAIAQDKTVNVGWVYAMVPKPGMTKQFEEGRKRHMDWHRKQNDTWSWETWEVVTGQGVGSYISATFGHSWQDLDTWEQKLGDADSADTSINLQPSLASTEAGIWMYMPDVSRPIAGNAQPKLAQVNHFLLKPGSESDFNDAVRKINDAINKVNWPLHYGWYVLIDGGEQPHYVLLIHMNGWADMAEPDPPFPAMLEKAVGKHDAEALMHAIDNSIKREWSETIRYRSDLSYHPASK